MWGMYLHLKAAWCLFYQVYFDITFPSKKRNRQLHLYCCQWLWYDGVFSYDPNPVYNWCNHIDYRAPPQTMRRACWNHSRPLPMSFWHITILCFRSRLRPQNSANHPATRHHICTASYAIPSILALCRYRQIQCFLLRPHIRQDPWVPGGSSLPYPSVLRCCSQQQKLNSACCLIIAFSDHILLSGFKHCLHCSVSPSACSFILDYLRLWYPMRSMSQPSADTHGNRSTCSSPRARKTSRPLLRPSR